jgi:tRNA-dihydrouridine synthase B
MKKLKIGNVKLENPLILAPMVDVSDLAFRLICRRAGASIGYTEMLQVEALDKALNEKALKLKTLTNSEDKPLGIQITGRRVSDFGNIIPELRKYNLVDLNCGCPGHLTIDHGSGSYLMKSPDKIAKIIRLLKDNDLNVTAKIRLGFNKNNVIELAKKIDSAGADALSVHGRLASQGRGSSADWSWFSKIKDKIGIPLIGNGDVRKPEDAEEILKSCDGVMIAREAIGNPLIFKQTLDYFDKGKYKETDYKENLKLYLDYLKLAREYGLLKMSKVKYIGGKFLRGFENAPQVRNEFMKLRSFEDVEGFVRKVI